MTTQATSTGEVCRLTVYGPRSRVELAVPAHVPIADLMPTVLGYLGPELADSGLAHGGWVLQQLGEPPLDEDQSTAALGLYDGDILHLRPRNDQLAPVDYDDLADGVAEGIAERPDAWRPRHSYRLTLATAGALLATGLAVLPMLAPGLIAAIGGAVTAIVLICASAGFVRGYDDRGAGIVLAWGAVAYAGLAGLMLPSLATGTVWALEVQPAGLLAAGGLAAVAALGARAAAGQFSDAMVATALAGAVVALTGVAWAVAQDASAGAAAVLPVVLLMIYYTPAVAARAAHLTIEPPAVTPEEFQQGLDPVPAADLRQRTATADAHVSAIFIALAVVTAGLQIVLSTRSELSFRLLVIAGSALLLLHSRELVSARQRVASFGSGVVGPVAVLVHYFLTMGFPARLAVFGALAWGAVGACVLARMMPGRRMLPRWGLLGDIAHWVLASSILPLVFAATGLYGYVRGMWL